MRVLLEIAGWKKEMDIDQHTFLSGVVKVEFTQPPIKWAVPADRTVVPKMGISPVIQLYHVGRYERNLPVFEFR